MQEFEFNEQNVQYQPDPDKQECTETLFNNEPDNAGLVKNARRYFSKIGFRLVLCMVAFYGICYGAQILIFHFFPELSDDYTSSLIVAIIPQYLIAMPLMAFIICVKKPGIAPEKRRVGFGWCVLFFLISYAVMYASNLFATVLNMILSSFFGGSISNYAIMEYVENADIGVVSIVVVLCAPIFEELIFRKFLIDRCGTYGQAASALVSGLAFGLFHGNLTQAIYAFCLGYLFAIIYSKTGKIYITIGIHMVINFLGSFVALKVLKLVDLEALENLDYTDIDALMNYLQNNGSGLVLYSLYSCVIFAVIAAGVVLLIVNRRKFIPEKNGIKLPAKTTFKTVMFNPGMIVFWALNIVYIIYTFWMGLVA